MKYFVWALKLLVILIAAFSYFCMIKVLYCGCQACNTCIAIGIAALLIALYDRYREFRAIQGGEE